MTDSKKTQKTLVGTVVSDKMDKTIVVLVERRLQHHLYDRIVRRSKKFHVHDEHNTCGIGDVVKIVEGIPMSKTKAWRLLEVVEKAK